jgi:hypothetical protein
MQLDKTRIAIRERGTLDMYDISLQVIREFFRPLLVAWLLAAVPLLLLNYFLIGWMVGPELEYEAPVRYCMHYLLLLFVESPLLSIPIVGVLGPAVFLDRPSWRIILAQIWQAAIQLSWCLLLLRGILFCWLFAALRTEVDGDDYAAEVLLYSLFVIWTMAFHAFRPFTVEIILLEKLPLFAKHEQATSLHRRSSHLHGPAAHNLLGHWLIGLCAGGLLVVAFTTSLFSLIGVLFSEWTTSVAWKYHWVYPLPFFLAMGYLSVVRFLQYLDVRIRNEGWEVELLLIAESRRLQSRVTT